MKAGVGYYNSEDPFLSGKTVAKNSIVNGDIDRPDIVIGFCCAELDHEGFFSGLRSVVGDKTPIIGGPAIGIITNDDLSYQGFPAGAEIIQSDDIEFQVVSVGGLNKSEKQAGIKLSQEITADKKNRLLLFFYDSIKIPASEGSPPILNTSSDLIEGIEQKLPSKVR